MHNAKWSCRAFLEALNGLACMHTEPGVAAGGSDSGRWRQCRDDRYSGVSAWRLRGHEPRPRWRPAPDRRNTCRNVHPRRRGVALLRGLLRPTQGSAVRLGPSEGLKRARLRYAKHPPVRTAAHREGKETRGSARPLPLAWREAASTPTAHQQTTHRGRLYQNPRRLDIYRDSSPIPAIGLREPPTDISGRVAEAVVIFCNGESMRSPGYMREYLTQEQFTQVYTVVATDVEVAIRIWATKVRNEGGTHARPSFEQARGDADRRQWEVSPLIVSGCPERGNMYDMANSDEFTKTLLGASLRELSDPVWWDPKGGFRMKQRRSSQVRRQVGGRRGTPSTSTQSWRAKTTLPARP